MPKPAHNHPYNLKRGVTKRSKKQPEPNVTFRERLGVDVVEPAEEADFTDGMVVPSCSHGKCLLFKLPKSNERWFGCSLHRSEAECPFKCQWPIGGPIAKSQKVPRAKLPSRVPIFEKIRKMPTFYFCLRCLDVFEDENAHFHGLRGPYKADETDLLDLIMPEETDHFQAQYWFTSEAIQILFDSVLASGKTHFLCVGTPQVFNFLLSKPEYRDKVYLLDIDERFRAIYDDDHFSMFNMINGEFWTNEAGFSKFLQTSDKLAVICDPPFAVFIKVLLKTLNNLVTEKPETDFVFTLPYFLDRHLFREMPNLKMIDYAITYQNHPKYKSAKNSPVRFFTTLPPECFTLPGDLYKNCPDCNRYVAKTNQHCYDCKSCPSRDGSAVQHCLKCRRCVPLKYSHCNRCNTCSLKGRCHA
uniref:CTCHY-type domain-containing protein n=1 Tax=Panagrellus redivivus TaxID=6233 RepID=A0A7E4WB00_PANRE